MGRYKHSYWKKRVAISGAALLMIASVGVIPESLIKMNVSPTVVHADTNTDVTTVSDFDNTHTYTSANSKVGDLFKSSGSAKTPTISGNVLTASLTSRSSTGEVGAVGFTNQINFGQDFKITGQIGFSDTTGDGISVVFAPVNPNKIASGVAGAGLGLWGLPNAFGLVYDMYANNGDTHYIGTNNFNMGDFNNKDAKNADTITSYISAGPFTDGMSAVPGNNQSVKANSGSPVGATEQVINWRFTDGSGKLIAVDGANKNDKLDNNPGNQVASINSSLTSGYENITISYSASTGKLTISIPDNAKKLPVIGTLLNQTYGSNTDAKTWTMTIPASMQNQGYAMGVVASDSSNSDNNFNFKLNDYSMPVKTANVTFDGKANASVANPSDFNFTKSTGAIANVGDVITVIPDASYLADAQKLANFDPDYVYIAPKVKGYAMTAPQQFTVGQNDSDNNFVLDYSKAGSMTVHYQIKGQAAGSYIDDVVVKNGSNTTSGLSSKSYSIETPLLPGYTADKTVVTGAFDGSDETTVVTYTPVTVSPLDPSNPNVSQPVKPVDTVTGNAAANPTSGSLTLDYAPSFNFGTQTISTGAQKYYATSQKYSDGTKNSVPYVQVSDRRPDKSGWKLNAMISNFKDSDGDVLPITSLDYQNGALKVATDNSLPTPNVVGNGMSSSFTTNELVPNVATTIISAPENEGHGTFLGNFGSANDLATITGEAGAKTSREVDKDVALNVVNGQNAKSTAYQASITWTLSDTPSN
ncbi:hypothetical protein EQG49_03240 [Periweissella cryptocerci]|uniref:WxL domain-containing protein n=1 Tax=Periweissella cryptocerci TaxID=2506420 RepID=A0A4P6YSD1_9LACO|nr:WxL domain-containing protein [Periweissella cryptocerci]QBO35540.1 hypothetical protein EQG49_03240 [Periweissella cryptocerci]